VVMFSFTTPGRVLSFFPFFITLIFSVQVHAIPTANTSTIAGWGDWANSTKPQITTPLNPSALSTTTTTPTHPPTPSYFHIQAVRSGRKYHTGNRYFALSGGDVVVVHTKEEAAYFYIQNGQLICEQYYVTLDFSNGYAVLKLGNKPTKGGVYFSTDGNGNVQIYGSRFTIGQGQGIFCVSQDGNVFVEASKSTPFECRGLNLRRARTFTLLLHHNKARADKSLIEPQGHPSHPGPPPNFVTITYTYTPPRPTPLQGRPSSENTPIEPTRPGPIPSNPPPQPSPQSDPPQPGSPAPIDSPQPTQAGAPSEPTGDFHSNPFSGHWEDWNRPDRNGPHGGPPRPTRTMPDSPTFTDPSPTIPTPTIPGDGDGPDYPDGPTNTWPQPPQPDKSSDPDVEPVSHWTNWKRENFEFADGEVVEE
jgi:hypothetical protein